MVINIKKLKVYQFSTADWTVCGITDSCGYYYMNFPLLTDFQSSTLFVQYVRVGYNKIDLTICPNLRKGSMIVVDTTLNTVQLAIDNSGSAVYSDYIINSGILLPINSTANYKFHFNCYIANRFYNSLQYYSFNYTVQGSLIVNVWYRGLTNIISRTASTSMKNSFSPLKIEFLFLILFI